MRISIKLRGFSAELMLWGLHSTDWFQKTGPILAHFLMSTPTMPNLLFRFVLFCCFSSSAVLLKMLFIDLLSREIVLKLMQTPGLQWQLYPGGAQRDRTTADDSALCHFATQGSALLSRKGRRYKICRFTVQSQSGFLAWGDCRLYCSTCPTIKGLNLTYVQWI